MGRQIARRIAKPELSHMNIFCAFLVIFIHCASVIIGETTRLDTAFNAVFIPWRFSTFVVPAFIFLSGVKLFLTDKKIDYIKFYKGRITRVILPYLLWVFIFYIFFVNHHYFEFSWYGLFHAWWRGDLVGHFYFVIIIVQFYILMPLWVYALRRVTPAVGIAFSVLISVVLGYNLSNILYIILPNHVFQFSDVIFTKYLLYWVCGCYVGMNYQKFKELILNRKILITALFLFSGFLDIYLAYATYNTAVPWMEEVHILYCSSAILFFFMLFCWICDKRKPLTWFTRALDSQCYNIYLSHCLIILWLNDYLLTEMKMTDVVQRFWIVALSAYLGSFIFWMLWWGIKTGTKAIFKFIRTRLAGIKNAV